MVAAVVGSGANGLLILILFVSLRTLRSRNKTPSSRHVPRACRRAAERSRPRLGDGGRSVVVPSGCGQSERRPSSSRRAMISCDLNVVRLNAQ